MSQFASISQAIEAYRRGELLVVVDDADRENEGDLVCAADAIDHEKMAFMIRHTSGVICAPMPNYRADELELPLMVVDNRESMRTAFTVTTDYRHDTTTGISASDRVATVRALARRQTGPNDLVRPGHIFPLRAREGGVLKRAGHTEAAVDLGRLSGRSEVGVLSEVVNDDGTMARLPDLVPFAKRHGLHIISIADLIRYRLSKDKLVEPIARSTIDTAHGEFEVIGYCSILDGQEHVAYVMGNISGSRDVLVRVQSECLNGDVFGSVSCDCRAQLDGAIDAIATEGRGVILYLRGAEGRSIGCTRKVPVPRDKPMANVTEEVGWTPNLPVDTREYGLGAQILKDLGVSTIRLMTNNPVDYRGLQGFDLEIVEKIPLAPEVDRTREHRGFDGKRFGGGRLAGPAGSTEGNVS